MPPVIDADETTFNQILQANAGPVLVSFGAPWCGPCRTLDPILEQLAQKMPDLQIVRVNADQAASLVGRFDVRAIPALYIARDGKVSAPYAGPQTTDNIARWAQKAATDKPIPALAVPRSVAEADPAQAERQISLRVPAILYNGMQAGAGYMLLAGAASPLMAGIAGAIIAYSALRVVQGVFTSANGRRRRLNELLDKLAADPGRRSVLLPRYAMAAARTAGNAAVLVGGITLVGAAFSAASFGAGLGLLALGAVMIPKGGLGVLTGLAGLAATAALPQAAQLRARKGAESPGGDDAAKVGSVMKLAQPGIGRAVHMADAFEKVAAETLPAVVAAAKRIAHGPQGPRP